MLETTRFLTCCYAFLCSTPETDDGFGEGCQPAETGRSVVICGFICKRRPVNPPMSGRVPLVVSPSCWYELHMGVVVLIFYTKWCNY